MITLFSKKALLKLQKEIAVSFLSYTMAKLITLVQQQNMAINCGAQQQTIMINMENGETVLHLYCVH